MTFTNSIYKNNKSFFVPKRTNPVKFIIKGQGVLLFNAKFNEKCVLELINDDKTNGLIVEFTKKNVWVRVKASNKPLYDPNNKMGLINKSGVNYWFSLDSQNQRLFAGIGEARMETIIYHYQFNFTKEQDDLRKANKQFLESLGQIELSDGVSPFRLLRDPITSSIPLVVKNTDDLSMNDIANGTYMPKANLSTICQKLYDCISGKNFILNDSDFPDFSEAIEYSIRTPGLWCYEKLKEKSTEFSKDKPNLLETYLRITLGENNGESPGIPYVMEIWPVGHYSPVHSHAAANAIIRVLSGKINVSLFPFLCGDLDGVKPFGVANFSEEQVTWISQTLNQVHQLKNLDTNDKACITIQCYMYDEENSGHYDYFDYVDADGKIQQYEPDSDMDFIEFKQIIKNEWESRNKLLDKKVLPKNFYYLKLNKNK
jgi:hypothetical protein